jgi:hypothetical protein
MEELKNKLLEGIKAFPDGVSSLDLAVFVHVSFDVVDKILRTLVSEGKIRKEKFGLREYHYYPK